MTRPTLTVPGNPADWLSDCPACATMQHDPSYHDPALSWVPVDELAVVPVMAGSSAGWRGGAGGMTMTPSRRPLRAGDVVTLTTERFDRLCHAYDHPFATAKVAEVVRVESNRTWDGETFPALCRTADGEVFLRTGRGEYNPSLPGDWSSARFGVRLDNVEALT